MAEGGSTKRSLEEDPAEAKVKVECDMAGAAGHTGGAAAEQELPEQPQFSNGDRVQCRWDDDSQHQCEILDTRQSGGKSQYYVHYIDYDRRLDDWVDAQRLSTHTDGSSAKSAAGPPGAGGEAMDPSKVKGFLTRNQRRRMEESAAGDAHSASAAADAKDGNSIQAQMEREHVEKTKVKNIRCIQLGKYEIDCWYFSPYPEAYSQDKLFICEYSLKYFKSWQNWAKHKADPANEPGRLKRPPGQEIYNDGLIRVFEVDGREHKLYCQCLCLLAKLFLDHKTLYYDVEPFLFYVFTETDSEGGCHVISYFSKEKFSADDYNLACILTLPPYQRKGFGKFVIAFSYELSKVERKVGTPERPLSDLGQLSYKSFWTEILVSLLWAEKLQKRTHSTVEEMSARTFIKQEDIVWTLQALGLVQYWKGQYIVNPNSRSLEEQAKAVEAQLDRRPVRFKPECLCYSPRNWEIPNYGDA